MANVVINKTNSRIWCCCCCCCCCRIWAYSKNNIKIANFKILKQARRQQNQYYLSSWFPYFFRTSHGNDPHNDCPAAQHRHNQGWASLWRTHAPKTGWCQHFNDLKKYNPRTPFKSLIIFTFSILAWNSFLTAHSFPEPSAARWDPSNKAAGP